MSDTSITGLNVKAESMPVQAGSVTIIPEPQILPTSVNLIEGTPVTVVEKKVELPAIELNPQTINLRGPGIVLINQIVAPENQETLPAQETSKPETTPLPNGTVVAEGETAPEVVDPITAQPIGE
jgi:hypothetical protein